MKKYYVLEWVALRSIWLKTRVNFRESSEPYFLKLLI